jgi:uncharacterized protein YjbI with pentapeptide repeats
MYSLLYRLFIFFSFIIIAAATAAGATFFAPSAATLPMLVLVIGLPALAFMAFTYLTIEADTLRRIENRGNKKLESEIFHRGRKLDHVDAGRANFTNLNLEGFSFRNANLERADLMGVKAMSIDLSKAFAEHAKMTRGNFKYGRFLKARLKKSRMRYSDFTGANFSDADLRNCNLKGSDFTRVNFKGANLKGAVFDKKTILPFSTEKALKRGMIPA